MQEKTIQYQLLPPLSEEEMAALRADIQAHGVQVPIELDEEGNVLDGHHRLRICQELGIKDYASIIRPGLSEDEKLEHVLRLNLIRRHLSVEQRKELVGTLREKGWSTTRIAEVLGQTHQAISKGLQDAKSCNLPSRVVGKDGKSYPAKRPSVIAKVQHEVKKMCEALQVLEIAGLPKKMLDGRRVIRLAREQKAEVAAQEIVETEVCGEAQLWLGDFRERGKEIADSSVDLIFTDPPYSKEALPLWADLSSFAARVLKPSGMLIAYTGAMYLPEVIGYLMTRLRFWWAGAIVFPGAHSRVHARNIAQGSKPLLFFTKENFSATKWIEDTYTSESVQKQEHQWQQSIGAAIYYIKQLVPPGGIVVDPFLGGGTTGLAAKHIGRAFVGIEIEPRALGIARERIKNG